MVMHTLFASYVMYICTMSSHDFNYFFFLFPAVLPDRYNLDSHHIIGRSHLFHEPGFSEGDSILQVGSSFVHIQIHLKNIYFCSICMHIFFPFLFRHIHVLQIGALNFYSIIMFYKEILFLIIWQIH